MSINKVILIGNVGKDPEIREVSGNKVASFTLATTDKGYSKADGTQVPERTEWHNIVVWGKLADVCAKYVRKGSKLYVEGKLRTRAYDSKAYFNEQRQPCKCYSTEVFLDNMEMLDKAPQQSAPAVPAQPPIQPAQPVQPQGLPQPPQQPYAPVYYAVPPQAYVQQSAPQQPQGYQPAGDGLPF